jgi:uncharacterized protein
MIDIEPIGAYFELDHNGFILNPTGPGKITQDYVPLIDEVIALYVERFQERLHSIYLRGSVACGRAILGVSDLDVVGLLVWEPKYRFLRWGAPNWSGEENARLCAAFPFVPKIDFAVAHHDPAFPGQNLEIKLMLKTQALCVYGENVLGKIPPFKPGKVAMFNYKWLGPSLGNWKDEFVDAPLSPEKIEFVKTFTKVILRTGFELVMLREGKYTVDLYPCWLSFSNYYPEKSAAMEQILRLHLNTEALIAEANEAIYEIVPWMVGELQETILKKG